MKLFIVGLMAVFLTQCTIVTPSFMGSLGTDTEEIDYQGQGKGGPFSYKAKKQVQSKSFAEINKTARHGLTMWGTVESLRAVADGVKSVEATKQTKIKTDGVTKQTELTEATKQLEITTPKPEVAPVVE